MERCRASAWNVGTCLTEILTLGCFSTVYQLTGEIPKELGSLVQPDGADLSDNNQLTGEIPPELGRLSNLTVSAALVDNQLTGEIPPELGGLSNLTGLWLLTGQPVDGRDSA